MGFEVQQYVPPVELPTNTLLRAKLVKFEVKEVVPHDKSKKPFNKINWFFEVTENSSELGEFFGEKVRGETSAYLTDHPENEFRLWAEALLGREIGLGTILAEDGSDLVGLPCLITVKYELDRQDSSKKYKKVESVLATSGTDEPPF